MDSTSSEPAEPQQSTFRSLLRLRPWFRPHRKAVIAMIVCASGAMLAQSLVPLVIGAVVDGPIRHHDTSRALAAGRRCAGSVRARRGGAVLRPPHRECRRPSLGIEADLRRDMFAHIQRLPVSFHDRWPSGQLLSAHDQRSLDTAALHRLRLRVPDREHRHTALVVLVLLLNIHFWLGLFVIVAMGAADRPDPAHSNCATARRRARAGSHRRPRHVRRGIGARHPGDQVLRTPPAHAGGFTRDAQRLRSASWSRSTPSAGSGRCSRAIRSLVLAGVVWGGSRRWRTAR